MSTVITFLDSDEIARRRRALLEEAGADLAELRARREQGILDIERQGILDELENLDFLDGAD